MQMYCRQSFQKFLPLVRQRNVNASGIIRIRSPFNKTALLAAGHQTDAAWWVTCSRSASSEMVA
ncbi:hypothetical protein O9H85_30630 [Paenibacillus filicis]|uniref:Uncharacterized protein n=1 Tax=Paenibacillus gyeongsangnamensis TaxID=3388067 RepID=A0ABT4QIG1_9BACL|nr:hypothetical protein [Paenibacillus filicis]MCZ8516663.1 hypothetical protein [Paenibacillus filicis]